MAPSPGLGASFYVALLAVVAAQFLSPTWGGAAPAHDVAGHPVTPEPGENDTATNGTVTEEDHSHPPPYEIVFLFGSCVFGGTVRRPTFPSV